MRPLITTGLWLFAVTLLSSCSGIPPYNADAKEQSARSNPAFKAFTHSVESRRLAGVTTGNQCDIAVLFIHGAPGDWKAWGDYLAEPALTDRADMIAIDRPGFGDSDPGQRLLSLEDQAKVILEGARQVHKGPFVLVGHSYGGPVQFQIAMDYPDDVAGMVVLAGAVDPVLQASRWYHYLADTWLAAQILPEALDVTTDEMLSLPEELVNQRDGLSAIEHPVTVIQGEKDWLVPQGNEDYIANHLTNAEIKIIRIAGQGHFLPWEQYDLVRDEIGAMLPSNACSTKANQS